MIDELRRVWRWCGLHHHLLFLKEGPFHSTSVSKEGYLTSMLREWSLPGRSSISQVWMVDDKQKNLRMMRDLEVPPSISSTVINTYTLHCHQHIHPPRLLSFQ